MEHEISKKRKETRKKKKKKEKKKENFVATQKRPSELKGLKFGYEV